MSKKDWILDPVLFLPFDPNAETDCEVCGGTGVVSTGEQYSCTFDCCPRCIKKKEEN